MATVTAIDGRRVDFGVAARDKTGTVGMGTHSRFVVDVARFMARPMQSRRGNRAKETAKHNRAGQFLYKKKTFAFSARPVSLQYCINTKPPIVRWAAHMSDGQPVMYTQMPCDLSHGILVFCSSYLVAAVRKGAGPGILARSMNDTGARQHMHNKTDAISI